ncbi:TetR/AcrR family transcriptional regulator [Sphingomonas sp. CLY1604]|uniref:TetR/AcrR family transcriptional regulator n=1 Tax=Sphingomonas sp. CLY1604 TaxID=3457786 RepID=UPI003FD81331
MTSRSPSAHRVTEAAVHHFSVNGYDGGSLNEIAEAAGIRKATLYSHFSGKDELFLAALDDASAAEGTFVAEAFARADDPLRAPGLEYVSAIAGRYEDSVFLRFLVRTVYLVPTGLKGEVTERYTDFLAVIRRAYRQALDASARGLTAEEEDLFCEAYAGIVESLFVELTYGNELTLKARQVALWHVLADSLQLRSRRLSQR